MKSKTALILITLSIFQTSIFAQEQTNLFYLEESNYLKDFQIQSFLNPQIASRGFGSEGNPPLNSVRVAGELLWGTAMGCAGGCAGVTAGLLFLSATSHHPSGSTPPGDEGLWELMAVAALGFMVGYPIGSAVGVYQIGNRGDETGSFIITLIGSCVAAIAYIVPAPIGATIAFNMTRKYKNMGGSSLINMENGKINLTLPDIYLKKDFTDSTCSVQSMKLFTVGF